MYPEKKELMGQNKKEVHLADDVLDEAEVPPCEQADQPLSILH